MKITKYFLSLAAAIGMIAGCQKQEIVQISAPEDVVAPVLQSVADIDITPANLVLSQSLSIGVLQISEQRLRLTTLLKWQRLEAQQRQS